jgi:hypothetical protein
MNYSFLIIQYFQQQLSVERINAKSQALETQTPIPIFMVATPVQVPVEPKTVYVVLTGGVAVTLAPFGELNVADGNQV